MTRPATDPAVAGPSAHPAINLAFLVIFVGGAAALASLEVTPQNTVRVPWADRELLPTCVHVATYGGRCSSCGITRSLVAAMHGDFAQSRDFHPAGLPILAMLLCQCAMRLAFLGPRLHSARLDIVVSAGMLIAFAVLLNG